MEDKDIFPMENEIENIENTEDTAQSVAEAKIDTEVKEPVLEGVNFPIAQEKAKEEELIKRSDRILPPDEIFSVYAEELDEQKTEDAAEEDAQIDGQFTITELTEDECADSEYECADAEDETPELQKEKEEDEPYNEDKPRKVDSRFDFIELFVFTLLAVMLITSFFFRHSVVSGESMQNTLQDGEHLIISDFFYSTKRGDIIVCEDYTTELRKPIVKRVIAVEGDTLEITENGEVYVNGELLIEDYVYIDRPDNNPSHKRHIYMEIKKGEIFVMGDHRNDSADSRDIGTVSEDSVLGRVLFRFYPFKNFKFF